MLKRTVTCLLFLSFFILVKAQTKEAVYSEWITVWHDNATPVQRTVEIAFTFNPKCDGYSFYKTRNNFLVKDGTITFSFDHTDCDGATKNEPVGVDLNHDGVDKAFSRFFFGTKILKIYPAVLKDPNRDEAISLKNNLDNTNYTFNKSYQASYHLLDSVNNSQKKQSYKDELDSYKSTFSRVYQQAVINYKSGNGSSLNCNLASLRDTKSKLDEYYLNMEGDLRIVYQNKKQADNLKLSSIDKKPPSSNNSFIDANSANTLKSSSATTQNTRQATAIQYHTDQATTNGADEISQAAQLSVAKINIAYQQTHSGRNIVTQQQQVVASQKARDETAKSTSNPLNSILGNALLQSLNSSNDLLDGEAQTYAKWVDYDSKMINSDESELKKLFSQARLNYNVTPLINTKLFDGYYPKLYNGIHEYVSIKIPVELPDLFYLPLCHCYAKPQYNSKYDTAFFYLRKLKKCENLFYVAQIGVPFRFRIKDAPNEEMALKLLKLAVNEIPNTTDKLQVVNYCNALVWIGYLECKNAKTTDELKEGLALLDNYKPYTYDSLASSGYDNNESALLTDMMNSFIFYYKYLIKYKIENN